jgi:hypothetical protein
LKVQVATSSQAIRQRRADYFYVFAEPSPSPSSIAIRRQHHPFCYSRSKLFNTASTRERAKFQQSYCCAFPFLKTVSGFDGHAASSQLFDDEERAVPVAASSHAVRQQRYKQRAMKKQVRTSKQPI